MNIEEKISKVGQGKLLRVAIPVLLPYIEEEIAVMISKITGDFVSGETNFISHAAKIATLVNMKDQLLAEDKNLERLQEETYGKQRR